MKLNELKKNQSQFNTRFPFDTKNLVGYLIAVIVEYLSAVNIEFFVMCVMIITNGPCLILISITKDMICSLRSLDKTASMKKKTEANQPGNIILQFNDFIQFHAEAKRSSECKCFQ